MKICRLISVLMLLSFVTITTPFAWAAEPGWYFGAGIGNSDPDVSFLDDDSGTKFFAGYNYDGTWGLEGAFVELGDFDIDTLPGSVEVDGFQFAAVGNLPVGEASLFGKAGFYRWNAEAPAGSPIGDDDGIDVMWGFGIAFEISDNWLVRGEWERFDIDGDDIDMLSISLVVK